MNEFVARNGLIALDSSSISGLLTLNGRLSSSNSADTTFLQGSRLVEILTTANGQYGVRSTEAIKAQAFYLANSVGSINAFNGDNLIYFNSSNNLGIGTTNPTAKLDVRGNIFLSGSITVVNNNGLILYDRTQTYGPGRIYTQYNYALGEIFIEASGSQAPTVFSPNGGVSIGGQSATSPVRGLFVSGSVGIGAPSPGATLHVSSSTAASLFRVDTAAGPGTLFVSGSGNVGIGTTTPLTALHVYVPVTGSGPERTTPVNVLTLESENTTAVEYDGFGQVINFRGATYNDATKRTLGRIIHKIRDASAGSTPNGTSLHFELLNSSSAAAPVERVVFDYTGNVGIGVTTPLATLHVSGGAIISNGLTVTGSILTTGNVTIRGQYLLFGGPLSVNAILTDGVLNQESLVYRSGLLPTSTNISDHAFSNGQGDVAITSGTRSLVSLARGFNPNTGNGVYNFLSISATISQSSATGISRGIYINNTITNAADYRAIEWTNNTGWGLYGNGSAASYFGGALAVGGTNVFATIHAQGNTYSGSTQTYILSQPGILNPLTNLYAIRSNIVGGGAATITNAYHYSLRQSTLGSSVITNQYGYYCEDLPSATNNYGFYGDVTAATGRWNIYMNGTANNYLAGRLGIGSTSLTNTTLRIGNNITGASSHFSVFASQTVQSDVANASIFTTEISTQATAFTLNTLRHYRATQGTFGASSIVTNQYGFFAESTLINATNNYGFWGDIPSGSGRWNLYMAGTANNYLAGNLGIGVTNPTNIVEIRKDQDAGTTLSIINASNTTGSRSVIGIGVPGAAISITSLQSNYTQLGNWASRGVISTDSGVTNGIVLTTTVGPIGFRPGNITGTDTMVVTGSNVGINTNSISYGSAANSAGRLTINNTSGNNGLVIRNADDGYALSIKTTTNDAIGVQFTWYNGATQTFLQHTGTVTRIGTNTAGYSSAVFDPSVIQFLFGTSEVARLTSGGNLGIGTTSPIYSLDVLSPTGTEPLTTNTDNYAARIKRTYTNTSGSVSSRRYNTFFETTYTGNQAYTNATGLYNYINYQNTNANSVISGIVSYIEPVSTVSASSLISFAAQVGTGGSITSVTGYNSNLLSLTAGTTTNARLFRAEALGSTNTVTNLYGFIAESTLTSATNNYGFYGNIAAATGRWNLYMNGTANNYLAGNLGLGVTSPLDRLHVDLIPNQYAYFGGSNTGAGLIRGLRFGFGQSGPFYWKSAIVQEQTGDAAARGKIHILNNNQFGSDNTSLSDARLTILPSGEVGINNQSPVFRLDVSGSFRASGSITATTGSDYFDISHDITQPAQTGSQVYEVNITPTLRYTAPNQTQTALRVAATFSGSTALSSSQSNIIADFGSTSAGSQLVINDTTSGSIYMVNDVSGLPIIEANSNWDVFIYDYPNVVLKKTGSTIEVSGSLRLNGSSLDTAWTSYTPQWTATVTNPVLNNGTITGAYKLIGKTCFVRVRLVIGSTTTLGSGQWYFSLPFSASIASGIQFPCSILDNGNAWYQGTVNGEYGGFTDRTAIIGQSSGSNSSQGISETFPIAWGNSDSLQFNGSYEIA